MGFGPHLGFDEADEGLRYHVGSVGRSDEAGCKPDELVGVGLVDHFGWTIINHYLHVATEAGVG